MLTTNKMQRHNRHYVVLTLALVGLIGAATLMLGPARPASAQVVAPSWSYTGNLNTARIGHTATLLPNGKVLVAGGFNAPVYLPSALNSVELYDPATGTWNSTGNLNTGRYNHTATLLQNGKVLVAGGGYGTYAEFDSAELYDPATGAWTYTGSLAARAGHTATLLQNGKVLVAGGGFCYGDCSHSSAQLYDPATGTWSITGSLSTSRGSHVATLLPNGKVLVAGGYNMDYSNGPLNSAEVYDPATSMWSSTGSLNTARSSSTSTLLPNGKVLVDGGFNNSGEILNNSAELYDLANGTWSRTGNLNISRHSYTATLLANGKVLVAAGSDNNGAVIGAELYDPTTGTCSMTANLNTARYSHTATLLPNGKVLVAGGGYIDGTVQSSAELYDPGTNSTPNPIDAAQFFVRQQYLDFLGREPDPIGFQNWMDTLTKCPNGGYGEFENPDCDRVHVSAGFFQSNEFLGRGYWILRFGFVGLNRSIGLKRSSATYAEFIPALQQVGGANSPAQEEAAKVTYANTFVQRSDFQALFPASLSNSQYVNALEVNAGVTLTNKQALIDALNNLSMTRADVLRNMVESQVVFDQFIIPSFVTMEYFGYLRRDVDEIGYRNWVDTLTADPSNYRHMIFGFIYSEEYRQRFGQP